MHAGRRQRQLALLGVVGASIEAWPEAQRLIPLPDAAGTPRRFAVRNAEAPAPALPALDPAAWSWLEVASGVPRIVGATAEHFVPQMINFDLVRGVSFSKGCYPGQEVVARSQYRGTVKRRMFRFAAAASAEPGAEVYHDGDPGQPAGWSSTRPRCKAPATRR
jgi:folate-binding protein YgfZ